MIDVIWDTETENLSLGLGRPWQLAYIVAENGKIKKKVNRHIDIHDLYVSKDAARITGFNYEKYNDIKVPANDVIDEFEPYLYGDDVNLIGHNILGFDVYMLGNLYEYAGRKIDYKRFVYRMYDTLAIARAQHFQSPCPKDKYDRLAWQYKHLNKFDKTVKTSLSALAKRNDIFVDDSKTHDALYDVEINYEVFKKIKYSLDF